MTQNKFRIITPSYNNEMWAEYNISSVFNQTYTNWEWIYINDNSTDRTKILVEEMMPEDSRITVIHNEKNKGAMWNYFQTGMAGVADDTIVVHLDGDDWLFDVFVLERLNEFYNKYQPIMTYGGMWVWNGGEKLLEANPQNSPYPDIIHDGNNYRRDVWRPSHLRTYRSEILKAIDHTDMIDPVNGEYYWEASDLSFQFPILEMAGKERIGVVDFPTCVYNAHPQQTTRTAGRQHSSRHWEIETEIRNKRKYRRYEGVTPVGKLPQVNIVGYQYDSDVLPTTFSIVYGRTDGEYDVTVITDSEIKTWLETPVDYKSPIVADLHESRDFSGMDEIYEMVLSNHEKFDLILTHDERLLNLPNAKLRLITWDTHLHRYIVDGPQVRPTPIELIESGLSKTTKNRGISCVSSTKNFLPGHVRRMEIIQFLIDTEGVDLFGNGIKPIESKLDALIDYKFSIVIENAKIPNWITEKLNDCLLTKTVPIYYGAPNVGEFFPKDAIIQFDSIPELYDIICKIEASPDEYYNSKLPYLNEAKDKAQEYLLTPDIWFGRFIETLIRDVK